MRQRWKDERLAGKLEKTLTIKGENINRVWLPDPFCYNARDSNLMLPDSAVHSKVSIGPDGNILYTRGLDKSSLLFKTFCTDFFSHKSKSSKLILKKHLRKMLESYHFIENNYNKQTLKLFW